MNLISENVLVENQQTYHPGCGKIVLAAEELIVKFNCLYNVVQYSCPIYMLLLYYTIYTCYSCYI